MQLAANPLGSLTFSACRPQLQQNRTLGGHHLLREGSYRTIEKEILRGVALPASLVAVAVSV